MHWNHKVAVPFICFAILWFLTSNPKPENDFGWWLHDTLRSLVNTDVAVAIIGLLGLMNLMTLHEPGVIKIHTYGRTQHDIDQQLKPIGERFKVRIDRSIAAPQNNKK
jgi:hypothetical protein